MNDTIIKELGRLKFEDIISLIFISCSILNLYGNDNQKKYLISNNKEYENKANNEIINSKFSFTERFGATAVSCGDTPINRFICSVSLEIL